MQVTIEIPDDLIRKVAVAQVEDMFRIPPFRNDAGGPGYAAVKAAIGEAVAVVDYRAVVQTALPAILDACVRDVLREEIRKRVKAEVKEMREGGTLFPAEADETGRSKGRR